MSISPNTTMAVHSLHALQTALRPDDRGVSEFAFQRNAGQVERAKVSEQEAQQVARHLNAELKPFNTELSFSVDKETEKIVIKIVSSETEEVVRQIPAEEVLRIAARVRKLLGLLVDGSV